MVTDVLCSSLYSLSMDYNAILIAELNRLTVIGNLALHTEGPIEGFESIPDPLPDNQPLFKNAVGSPGPVESEKSRAPLINQIEPCSSEKAILAQVKNNAKQLKDKLAPSV